MLILRTAFERHTDLQRRARSDAQAREARRSLDLAHRARRRPRR
jgi:hypothetical protein